MRTSVVYPALLLAVPTGIAAAEELNSGVQPGDLATPFNVKDVTGPAGGRSLCYR